jgi:hypothetical protein
MESWARVGFVDRLICNWCLFSLLCFELGAGAVSRRAPAGGPSCPGPGGPPGPGQQTYMHTPLALVGAEACPEPDRSKFNPSCF